MVANLPNKILNTSWLHLDTSNRSPANSGFYAYYITVPNYPLLLARLFFSFHAKEKFKYIFAFNAYKILFIFDSYINKNKI